MATPVHHDRRQALYEAYCAVPAHQRAEIIDGTLYVLPRPAPRHANATSVIGGGAQRGVSARTRRPRGLVDPVRAGAAAARLRANGARPRWLAGRAPARLAGDRTLPDRAGLDLRSVVEVDRGGGSQQELPIYAAHGVAHVWLVDPIAKTLEVYTLEAEGAWSSPVMFSGGDVVRAVPFDAIELDLSALWTSRSALPEALPAAVASLPHHEHPLASRVQLKASELFEVELRVIARSRYLASDSETMTHRSSLASSASASLDSTARPGLLVWIPSPPPRAAGGCSCRR